LKKEGENREVVVNMAGVVLEDRVAEAFRKRGYIVFTRKNHCDVLAVKPDMALAYLVECKDYELSQKHQRLAVRELNRNYVRALEILLENRLHPQRILKVLVASSFAYQARGVFQFKPDEFVDHVLSRE